MGKIIKKADPEDILKTIKQDELKRRRGKLKIFFGMAAGVGKTYSMLSYAQRLKNEYVDIVIGYIETHGRSETDKLTRGLEIIPRKKLKYKKIMLEEMDIDAVISRRPDIVLIDELAHTNVIGSRHTKRYLDVLEILDYGINVYTTLNIQHLESYSMTVEEITGIKVNETLPDLMLEYAESVELIDIAPEELLKRLKEGKVYTREISKIALENFFKKENLTALREMSLRYTAKKVDRQLQEFLKFENKIWKTSERILVAVSSSPNSQYVIKWAKRISFNLKVDWFVVYIERKIKLSENEEETLKKNLDLARDLGAEIIITPDSNVVSGILRIAYQKNISQIIVGKTLHKNIFKRIGKTNIIDRLIKESGSIDIYIASDPEVKIKRFKKNFFNIESSFKEYILAFFIICLVTFFNVFINHFTGYWTIGLIYLSAVAIIAIFLGRGPVILTATLSAFLWNILFIPPKFTIIIDKVEDVLMFGMYFIVALITGSLTSRLRIKELALRSREKYITQLYEISNVVSNTFELSDIIKNSVILIEKYLNAKTVFFLTDLSGNLESIPHNKSNFKINEKEYSAVKWSFDNKKPSGRFTDTLPIAEVYYLPLIGINRIYGIIGLNFYNLKILKLEDENFINNIVRLIASAIERFLLIKKMQEIKISEESDRMYKIILNSISHELRTPLTSMSNAAGGLKDKKMFENSETRNILLEDIIESTDRINRIVGNLLDMVRLESGKLKLKMEWNDINDIVSIVLKKLNKDLINNDFTKEIDEDLPLLYADFVLIEQVLTNIILNAIQHNKEGVRIILKIFNKVNCIYFVVRDNGIGIPETELEKVFDKFYRISKSKTGGTGLGLSICRSIIELHNGKIYAENNKGSGVSFIFYLPVNELKIKEIV